MVRAYHVIFGTYGFWLPNDPRGSRSDFVHAWELYRFGGKATKVDTRVSLADKPHNVQFRKKTKEYLKYPAVVLTQARSVATGFRRMMDKSAYRIYACSILPEHVHLVLGRHLYPVESMVRLLKAEASVCLQESELHPMQAWPLENGSLPTLWGAGRWKVFLNEDDDILRAIRYVEDNPVKEGKKPQRWSFVLPFSPGS